MIIKGPSTNHSRANTKRVVVTESTTHCGMSGSRHMASLVFTVGYKPNPDGWNDPVTLEVSCDSYEEIEKLAAQTEYLARCARGYRRRAGIRTLPAHGWRLCEQCDGAGSRMLNHGSYEGTCPACDHGETKSDFPASAT